jgi:adenylosuccinate synthase
MPGWQKNTFEVTEYAQLPQQAKVYIARLKP